MTAHLHYPAEVVGYNWKEFLHSMDLMVHNKRALLTTFRGTCDYSCSLGATITQGKTPNRPLTGSLHSISPGGGEESFVPPW